MNFGLRSFFLAMLTLVFACGVWGVEQPTQQDGREFLNRQYLEFWERTLLEGPTAVGKTLTELSCPPGKLIVGSEGEYTLRRNERGPNPTDVLIRNPEYSARIDFGSNGPVLGFYTKLLPKPMRNRFVDSVFISGSCYGGRTIPDLLRHGIIKVESYRKQDSFHYVRFVPNPAVDHDDDGFNSLEFVELRFDSRYPPLPDGRLFNQRNGDPVTFVWRDFVEIESAWYPQLSGQISKHDLDLPDRPSLDVFESVARTKYDPAARLDKSHCYLAHYGLPEPDLSDLPEIADFGRRMNRWFWPVSIAAVLVLAIVCYYLYRRRE